MITVKFGNYNYFDENDKRPIEWIVLDKKEDRYLLLSKYVIAEMIYNQRNEYCATWDKCDVRRWLNKEFLNEAFTPDEQEIIITTNVTADENPFVVSDVGNDTQDKVFLLSIMEVYKYFHSPSQRKCNWPEGFADQYSFYCYSACWWLRTSSDRKGYTSVVNHNGSISYEDHSHRSGFIDIRPAIWVKRSNMPDLPVENRLFSGYNEDSSLIDKLLVNKIQKDVVQKKLEEAREIARQQREYLEERRITADKAEQLYDKYEKTMEDLEDK